MDNYFSVDRLTNADKFSQCLNFIDYCSISIHRKKSANGEGIWISINNKPIYFELPYNRLNYSEIKNLGFIDNKIKKFDELEKKPSTKNATPSCMGMIDTESSLYLEQNKIWIKSYFILINQMLKKINAALETPIFPFVLDAFENTLLSNDYLKVFNLRKSFAGYFQNLKIPMRNNKIDVLMLDEHDNKITNLKNVEKYFQPSTNSYGVRCAYELCGFYEMKQKFTTYAKIVKLKFLRPPEEYERNREMINAISFKEEDNNNQVCYFHPHNDLSLEYGGGSDDDSGMVISNDPVINGAKAAAAVAVIPSPPAEFEFAAEEEIDGEEVVVTPTRTSKRRRT